MRGVPVSKEGLDPPVAKGGETRRWREELDAALAGSSDRDLSALLDESWLSAAALDGILVGSPYLRRLIMRDVARFLDLVENGPREVLDRSERTLAEFAGTSPSQAEMMTALRRYKEEAALAIGLADLAGLWPLEVVTHGLTHIADNAVRQALEWLLAMARKSGRILTDADAEAQDRCGLSVLALGKHGACELNYSSDIDLIVFYDPRRAMLAAGVEAQTFYVRLTQDLAKLLQTRTPDGYVFRVDLRLRPDPGSTALAVHIDAALHYYETFGQNWERAALIKARPIAGNLELGRYFLDQITPFIWRRYLDFAAIQDVHAMKRQIHAAKGHGVIAVAGHNVKLGRGGIREIEFFAQTQQLIAGGRHPELRVRDTLEALKCLTDAGWIDEPTRAELDAAYRVLRDVEHRLQMRTDEQTHTIPAEGPALEEFAHFAGFETAADFARALTSVLERVQGHYEALFETAPSLAHTGGSLVFTGVEPDPATVETLASLGFGNPRHIAETVSGWHKGRVRAVRSARARELLTELTPDLLQALSETENADQAFAGFDRFLSRLPSGVQLFSLLRSNPHLLRFVATILGTAPRLAETLSRRPHLIDSLIDPEFFAGRPTRDEMASALESVLDETSSYEAALDAARMLGQERMFLIGVRVLTRTIEPRDAACAFADLADLLIERLLARAWREFSRMHGHVAGGAIVVLGMGKLGGREMTASSDLDLIVIYDHDPDAGASDGPKALTPAQYFARLTQRLIASLAAPTARGRLYEVDLRLRPSGRSGPLATHVDGFASYQDREAWAWEHMALTRARVITGDEALAARVSQIIQSVLTRPRDRAATLGEVRAMRARLEAEKPPLGHWDLKLARGGLVDVEFVAQGLMLAHAAEHPSCLSTNTIEALDRLAAAGLLEPGCTQQLGAGARLLNTLTQVLRLCMEGRFDPNKAPGGLKALLASAAELPDFASLDGFLQDSQAAVRACFEQVLGTDEHADRSVQDSGAQAKA